MTGNETILLAGVWTQTMPLAIHLPHLQGRFRLKRAGARPGPPYAMALDTVLIDVVSEARAKHRLTLIWRGNFTNPADVEAVETFLEEIETGAEDEEA
jgi:hypothetical protein